MLVFALAIVFLLVFYLNGFVKKHSVLCYLFCTALSALSVYLSWSSQLKHMTEFGKSLSSLLINGSLGIAMFIFVMWAPVLHSALKSRTMRIRGELSIMASILILGHNISYGKTYFVLLARNPGRLEPHSLYASIVSIVMILIMLPLFVTSFKCIRRRMSSKSWKSLQKLAYVFYALTPLHVGLVWAKELRNGNLANIALMEVYILIYVTYAFARMEKFLVSKKVVAATVKAFIVAVLFSFAIRFPGFLLPNTANLQANSGIVKTTQAESLENAEEAVEADAQDTASSSKKLPGEYMDGEYTGAGEGYNADVEIKLIIKDNSVTDMELAYHEEDEPYVYWAFDGLQKQLINNQDPEHLDSVSEATTTSHGIMDAVADALKQAKKPE